MAAGAWKGGVSPITNPASALGTEGKPAFTCTLWTQETSPSADVTEMMAMVVLLVLTLGGHVLHTHECVPVCSHMLRRSSFVDQKTLVNTVLILGQVVGACPLGAGLST